VSGPIGPFTLSSVNIFALSASLGPELPFEPTPRPVPVSVYSKIVSSKHGRNQKYAHSIYSADGCISRIFLGRMQLYLHIPFSNSLYLEAKVSTGIHIREVNGTSYRHHEDYDMNSHLCYNTKLFWYQTTCWSTRGKFEFARIQAFAG